VPPGAAGFPDATDPDRDHRALAVSRDRNGAGIAPSQPMMGRVFKLVREVARGLFDHHAFDHAATLAFYFFLGTIPLLVLGRLLLDLVIQQHELRVLAAPLYLLMPGMTAERMGDASHDLVLEGAAAPLSLLGFAWLTSNGFHNLMDVFELLIGARPRAWWRQRLIALGCVALTLLVLVLATWFLGRVGRGVTEGWHGAGAVLVFAILSTSGLALFYRFSVVHPSEIRRHIWLGTAVAMTLFAVVTWAFGVYVSTIAHYAIFYGGLATVAVTLLWLYLSSLAFLIGAEVNAQLEGVLGQRRPI
jgi:membrane protein